MATLHTEYPQFFTATCLEWKRLLQPDKYKNLVVKSMRFLVDNNRVRIYGFVIITNHLHLIWQMKGGHRPQDVQRDFLKFTGQQIKQDLLLNHPEVLEHLRYRHATATTSFGNAMPCPWNCEEKMSWHRNWITFTIIPPAMVRVPTNHTCNYTSVLYCYITINSPFGQGCAACRKLITFRPLIFMKRVSITGASSPITKTEVAGRITISALFRSYVLLVQLPHKC